MKYGGKQMAFVKRLHRLFPADLATATAYYDNISTELGNRFRDSVRDRLGSIVDRPESYGVVRNPLRAALIDGFPYLLLFCVIGSTVYVAGLYHASSNPDRWLERASENG